MNKVPKKVLSQINSLSFVLQTFKNIEPQEAGNICWWDTQPEMWHRGQRELWDLVTENEKLIKDEILRILGANQ